MNMDQGESTNERKPFNWSLSRMKSAIKGFLKWHFSDLRERRTPERAEAEKTILGKPFNRLLMIPTALVMQLSVGAFYSFSKVQ